MTELHSQTGGVGGRLSLNFDHTETTNMAEFSGPQMPLIVTTKVGGIAIGDLIASEGFDVRKTAFLGHYRPRSYGGIIQADVSTISRNSGRICEEEFDFSSWGLLQAEILRPLITDSQAVTMFHNLRRLGVYMVDLPIVLCQSHFLNEIEFRNYVEKQSELRIALEVEGASPMSKEVSDVDIARATCEVADIQMFAYTGSFYGAIEVDEVFLDSVEGSYKSKDVSHLPMAEYIGWVICDTWRAPPRTVFERTTRLSRTVKRNKVHVTAPRSVKRRLPDGSFVNFLVISVRR